MEGRRVRHRIPGARNKTQALQAERKITSDIFAGRYLGRRGQVSLKKLIEEIFAPWAKQNKRSAQGDLYRAGNLVKFFGGKTLAEISPLLIEKYKRWRADSPSHMGGHVKPGTINTELALLSRIFSMAVSGGLVTSNPCSRVRRLRVADGRERVLAHDEEVSLCRHAPRGRGDFRRGWSQTGHTRKEEGLRVRA